MHDHDAVRHAERLFLIVGDIDRGDAQLLLDRPDLAAQGDADFRIERGKRLIKQQDLRAHRKRAGQRHALLLATRKLEWIAVAKFGQADGFKHFGHPLGDHALVGARDLEAEGHVLRHREVGKKRIGLKHHADVALVGAQAQHILAVDVDGALRGGFKPRHHAQGGGFAAARGAKE
jgi:hypothetical protein